VEFYLILCDIGNSFYHFFDTDKGLVFDISVSKEVEIEAEKIYFISVNEMATRKLQKSYDLIDLSKYIDFKTKYVGLGVDRAFASISIRDGVIVDAGSAITVDLMQDSKHLGGFILAGVSSYRESYKKISDKLDFDFNKDIDLDKIPLSTQDAITYASIKSIKLIIEDFAKNKKIYFTGGDGEFLSKFFENGSFDKNLLFKGMQRVIENSL